MWDRRRRPGRWDASRDGERCWQGHGDRSPGEVELFDRVGDPLLGRHDERRQRWQGRIPRARMRFPAMFGYSGPIVRCLLWGLQLGHVMLISLTYRLVLFVVDLGLVRTRSGAQLRAELLALRDQFRVLERKGGKPAW